MASGFTSRWKGKIKAAMIFLDGGSTHGLWVAGSGAAVRSPTLWSNAGAPTSGGSGTFVNYAAPGDLLVDTTDHTLYINTNTLASPTWTLFSLASGAGAFTGTFDGLVGSNTPAALVATTIGGTNITASGTVTATGNISGPIVASSISNTGLAAESVAVGLTASVTQTRAGGLALTKTINVVATVANTGDAVTLPAMTAGQSATVYNNGSHAMSVFPNGASDAIDGAGGGAAATLTNAKRARFRCVATNVIISDQLGAVSA